MRFQKWLLVMALAAGGVGAPATAAACTRAFHEPATACEAGGPDGCGIALAVTPTMAAADPDRAAVPAYVAPARRPLEHARDYGRLLILLSVPAAFVGLHLHLSRRAHIVPPSP